MRWALTLLTLAAVVSLCNGGTIGEVNFQPCDFKSKYPGVDVQVTSGECALVTVPLDWVVLDVGDKADYETIQVHMFRMRSSMWEQPGSYNVSKPAPNGQLVFFTGGPAHTGPEALSNEAFLERFRGYDLYFPEMRGLAWSTPVPCPDGGAPSTSNGCPQYLNENNGTLIRGYTLTNGARDVAYIMEQVRKHDRQQLGLYGVSFGTAWMNRYVQIAGLYVAVTPERVVFDSTFAPGVGEMQAADSSIGDAGRALFTEASESPLQTNVISIFKQHANGSTALGLLDAAFRYMNDASDPSGDARVYKCLTEKLGVPPENAKNGLKKAMGDQMFSYYARILPLVIILRLTRCAPRDVAFLSRVQFTPWIAEGQWPGDTLQASVFLGPDMYAQKNKVMTESELLRDEKDSYFSNFGTYGLQMYNIWPRYQADRFNALAASYENIDTLMLIGTLDANTPIRWSRSMSGSTGIRLLEFPLVPHVVIDQSPVLNITEGQPCGWFITDNFLSKPEGSVLDTACLDLMSHAPLDLSGKANADLYGGLSQKMFGTPDLWGIEGEPGPGPIRTPTPSPSPSGMESPGPGEEDGDGKLPSFYIVVIVLGVLVAGGLGVGFCVRKQQKKRQGAQLQLRGAGDGREYLDEPLAPYSVLPDAVDTGTGQY